MKTPSRQSAHPQHPKAKHGCRLVLSSIGSTGKAHIAFIDRNLRKAHDILQPPLRELSLALVGDQRMSSLHMRFMGIPGPTDVLTFPLDEDARGRVLAGEVVVCVPEATRQARRRGTSVRNEVLLYALHGMLHLCGFDDRTDKAYRKMHRMEDHLLSCLGIGPVFETLPGHRSSASHRRTC